MAMADSNALSSTLGLLAHLSIDELKQVLNDSDKFENVTKDANINVSFFHHIIPSIFISNLIYMPNAHWKRVFKIVDLCGLWLIAE